MPSALKTQESVQISPSKRVSVISAEFDEKLRAVLVSKREHLMAQQAILAEDPEHRELINWV